MLDPNRVIGAPYFVRTARLLDDTVFQGLLAEEDEKTITLKLTPGKYKAYCAPHESSMFQRFTVH